MSGTRPLPVFVCAGLLALTCVAAGEELGKVAKFSAGQNVGIAKDSEAPQPATMLTAVHVLRGHEGPALQVAVTPDGRRALTTGDDGMLRIWDLATGKELAQVEAHIGGSIGVAVSPDGKRALTSGDDRMVRLWDLQTLTELRRYEGHRNAVGSVVFSADGKRFLSGGYDQSLRLWDVEMGLELRRFGCRTFAWGTCLSSDGKRVLSAERGSGFRLLNAGTGEVVEDLDGGRDTIAFSPDGTQALTGSGWSGALLLWDLETGEQLGRLEGHRTTARFVAFSPDGRRAASTSYDSTVRLWDVQTGTELARFDWKPEKGALPGDMSNSVLYGLAFTPDGQRLLAAGGDGLVHVLEYSPSGRNNESTR